MVMNRYSQSMWYLICSQPPDCPPGTISAQVQIRASEKQESPRRAGGLCVSRRAKKVVEITHLCFCQVEDNEESLNPSFKGNQNQALVEDLSNSRYSSTESKQRKVIFIWWFGGNKAQDTDEMYSVLGKFYFYLNYWESHIAWKGI